ncbi:MAG: PilZ domain-containing protein [Sulfuricurvum sp.]|uniref:PilZ domain-containing protein n=1 Tax=Sulfuricurvum sp. TaxID=2025608 RepID=UPI0026074A3D|nr:PilZ domain-containing protein [Sulfuricurvum sp.]MDD2829022.1 PilZ domain-containing protein [Sulfuricurvum sp.]MDD4949669.1 PilZ domain-containing protein [Sulfuricurvum sp.]
MNRQNKDFLYLFQNLSHDHFDLKIFRITFIKGAWKVYNEIEDSPVSQTQFQNTITSFFDTLFSNKKNNFEKNVENIHSLFSNQDKVEQFLSDTFCIVLHHYIKSFYGVANGWEKIVPFTQAIKNLIANMTDHLNDESLFLFEDSLIDVLEILRQRSGTIIVLNTYYGVPIQNSAKIIHTDANSVILKAHPLQETAAIKQNGLYLLKNDEFKNDVYASVTPININGERFLELNRFDQLETSLFHRQSIRVQPAEPMLFGIKHSLLNFRSHLYDLSIDGVAVITKHSYPLSISSEVVITFPAEIFGSLIDIMGEMVYKSSYEGGFKYHFKTRPTVQQESELSKYIKRREQEIIKKLRDEIV